MEENHVPNELRIRLREYFMYAKAMGRQQYYSKLYDKMSPALRGEVAYHINQEWISGVPFLSRDGHLGASISVEEHTLFITDIAMNLKAEAYGPQEIIIKMGEKAEKMYIMQKGVVAKGGNIISGGRYFGEDIILESGRRTYMVRALTFTDVFVLAKTVLEKILDSANYFGIRDQIRRASLCESFKMSFIRLAHIKAGITNSQYVKQDVPGQSSSPPPPRGGGGGGGSGRRKNDGPEIVKEAQRELNISRKVSQKSDYQNSQQQIVPVNSTPMIQSPSPQRSSRKQSTSRRGGGGGDGGNNYSRSKPPRILEMLQSRHDELVQAIRGLAQRNDRRSDSIEDRLNKMSSNAMMGLAIMCVLLAGMVVGLLITGGMSA
jgi:CRP-like cAMP-binding protein